ncbi:ribonuclease P/MRP protein subunit POP5-like [Ptychodera flava]|uniref:ribonuclease P/MRP protein subunit POP5-like n=1 Tax=Ptychodera flava TaxID=63121 RepID=UPI00396A7C85
MVRYKNRYLLCELVFDDDKLVHPVEEKVIYFTIKQAIERSHGDYGIGVTLSGLNVKYLNIYTRIVLIRVRRDFYKLLWSALPFIRSIEKKPCFIHTLHLGGTIRSCQKFLLKYSRQKLVVLLQKCKTPEERKAVQKSILSCTLVENKAPKVGSAETEDDFSD